MSETKCLKRDRQLSSDTDTDKSFSVEDTSKNKPVNSKNKQESKKTKVSANQTTLDKYNKQSPKTMEGKMKDISTQLEKMSTILQQVVKISDLEEKLKPLVTTAHLDFTVQKMKDEFRETTEQLKGTIHDLKVDNDTLRKKVEQLEKHQRDQNDRTIGAQTTANLSRVQNQELEQHERLNSVRVYGITDKKEETAVESVEIVSKLFQNKLKVKIEPRDIDIAHRLGKYEDQKRRGIIVKCVRRMDKNAVNEKRRALAGTKIVIKEDLTLYNRNLINDAAKRQMLAMSGLTTGTFWRNEIR